MNRKILIGKSIEQYLNTMDLLACFVLIYGSQNTNSIEICNENVTAYRMQCIQHMLTIRNINEEKSEFST